MVALLAISLGYLMVILDATAVTVALPVLRNDFGAQTSELQWVLDAYTLVFAALLLSAGGLGDRIGSRRVFCGGLALFAAASAACGAAPSTTTLIAARAVQGIGAALIVPSSLALLRAAFPDQAARARALGVWGGIGGIGAASGPLFGGAVATGISWRAVFFVNLPVAAVALVLTFRALPADRDAAAGASADDGTHAHPRAGRSGGASTDDGTRAHLRTGRSGGASEAGRSHTFDIPAQLLAIAACALPTLALIEAGPRGWTDPLVLAGLALTPLAAAAFIRVERRAPAPMLPLKLFRAPSFGGGSVVGLLINLGFYGQLLVVTLVFQEQRGYSALEAGLALMPEAVFVSLGSLLSGRLIARGGARTPMLAGLATGAVGFAALAVALPRAPYPLLVVPLVLAGLGMSVTMPAATAAVVSAAPAERAGVAAGVLNAARQLGGAIGIALLGTLAASSVPATGLRVALGVAAVSFLLGAAVTAVSVARPKRTEGHQPAPSLSQGS